MYSKKRMRTGSYFKLEHLYFFFIASGISDDQLGRTLPRIKTTASTDQFPAYATFAVSAPVDPYNQLGAWIVQACDLFHKFGFT